MKSYVLDLSNAFTDHRQKVCIGRRLEWTAVGQLKQAVAELFHISSEVLVCCERGIYYPDTEHIDILPDNVTLKFVTVPDEQDDSDSEESVQIAKVPKRKSSSVQQVNGSHENSSLDIAKPKRRRLRKRKQSAAAARARTLSDAHTSDEVVVPVRAENGQPEAKLKSTKKEPAMESEVVVPFRNLRTELKARVVRAISPSILEPPAQQNGISNGGENAESVVAGGLELSVVKQESSVPSIYGNVAVEIAAV
uniref:Coilin N-terminal domain-containing protein n=1 Tax=Anopheles triannulatus TaxID=58253 RepID=A0A2M4ASS9_9DIPT